MKKFTLVGIDHADIVVTHACNMRCKFCIDKFRGTSTKFVSLSDVEKFCKLVRKAAGRKIDVLLLGGEPTMAGADYLREITKIVHANDLAINMSTNGYDRATVHECLKFMDWVQITAHNLTELDYWKSVDNMEHINIKFNGDQSFSLYCMEQFVTKSRGFKRRSVSMYFTPDFDLLCKDDDVWRLLNCSEWERKGSYYYTFYHGVRFKKPIAGVTNIADEPLIPKLYPNGNYNKTWCNEEHDPYLGEM